MPRTTRSAPTTVLSDESATIKAHAVTKGAKEPISVTLSTENAVNAATATATATATKRGARVKTTQVTAPNAVEATQATQATKDAKDAKVAKGAKGTKHSNEETPSNAEPTVPQSISVAASESVKANVGGTAGVYLRFDEDGNAYAAEPSRVALRVADIDARTHDNHDDVVGDVVGDVVDDGDQDNDVNVDGDDDFDVEVDVEGDDFDGEHRDEEEESTQEQWAVGRTIEFCGTHIKFVDENEDESQEKQDEIQEKEDEIQEKENDKSKGKGKGKGQGKGKGKGQGKELCKSAEATAKMAANSAVVDSLDGPRQIFAGEDAALQGVSDAPRDVHVLCLLPCPGAGLSHLAVVPYRQALQHRDKLWIVPEACHGRVVFCYRCNSHVQFPPRSLSHADAILPTMHNMHL